MKESKLLSATTLLLIVAMGLAFFLPLSTPVKASSSTQINQYVLQTSGSFPQDIAAGPDGNLWFTEFSGNRIGKITSSGTITEYSVPTSKSSPFNIAAGSDGNLWFTEEGVNKIGRVTKSGKFTEYTIPTPESTPEGITAGPDGNLWFTENNGNKIGRVTKSGKFTEYTIPTPDSNPEGITAGPDGNLWFTENNGNKIGRVTTSGKFTEYTIPTPQSGAWDITAGPDGNLWFVEGGSAKICKVTTSGVFTEYTVPTPESVPQDIAAGPDGNLWFTEFRGNRIGRVLLNPPIPTPSHWKSTFYFAEGYTGANFQEYACLENPNAAAADAWITFMFPDGSVKSQYYKLDPTSRLTVDINELAGAGKELSMRVVSTSDRIVAERPIYFDYNGVWTGGHDVVGATTPASSFYFAEGTCRPNFDPYFCIQNPGSTDADVTITYMKGDGTTKKQALVVKKNSRYTVKVTDVLGQADDSAHDFSAKVACTNGQQIIAERPMYFNYQGYTQLNWTGGHDVVGFTP